MSLSRFSRCSALILLILGIGFLRMLGPVPGLLPIWNHPLGLALLLLFVVWMAARADGRRLWPMPLLAGLLVEGWIRVAFLSPAFERWLAPRLSDSTADSLYVLLGGVWFVGLAWIFSRAASLNMGQRLSLPCWRNGLYLHTLSILVVYGLLAMLLQTVEGFRGLSVQVPIYASTAVWMIIGQIGLCIGEEAFYRGFVMGVLDRARQHPGTRSYVPRSLGLWLSSTLFALDHVRGMNWGSSQVMTFLYSFGLAVLLALLVHLTGNLTLAILAHLFHNLMVLRLGLWISDVNGFIDLQVQTYVPIYFIVTFTILFLIRRPAWEPLRRSVARTS
ncbi:MAG: CPBP family intramembrane metalloprotease [Acidobacteria bacterium]|nr:CPBP family intramembrane metalloprotease [Acidobacteriota bacterium]